MNIKKHPNSDAAFLGLILLSYFVVTLILSNNKPFWFDELFTYYLAQLNFSELIASLGPMDPHPPLDKLLVSTSHSLFGVNKLATRLPAIVSFGITIILTYCITKKEAGRLAGRISAILLLISLGQFYAYEARPYSLFILLTASLLYFFQRASAGKKRIYLLIFLNTVALLSTHFYAVFIPPFLLLGSVIRWFKTKSFDRSLWLSIILGYSVLILYLPAIDRITVLANDNWAAPRPWMLWVAMRSIYLPIFLILLLAIVKLKGHLTFLGSLLSKNYSLGIALVGIAALPILGYLLSFYLGAYHPRYFVPAIVPIVILASCVISTFGKKTLLASGILATLIFGYKISNQINENKFNQQRLTDLKELLNRQEIDAPIFISKSIHFLPLFYQEDMKGLDLRYLMESKGNYSKGGAADISILELSQLKPGLRVMDLNELRNVKGDYFYLHCGQPKSYELKKLRSIRRLKTIDSIDDIKLMSSLP